MPQRPAWYYDPEVEAAIADALTTAEAGAIATAITAAIAAAKVKAVNAQVGTTYTAALTDVGKIVTLNNASAITLTLPKDATVAFPVGGSVEFIQIGAGLVTFLAESGGGVINKIAATLKSNGRYSKIVAVKTAANTWNINGDLSAT